MLTNLDKGAAEEDGFSSSLVTVDSASSACKKKREEEGRGRKNGRNHKGRISGGRVWNHHFNKKKETKER